MGNMGLHVLKVYKLHGSGLMGYIGAKLFVFKHLFCCKTGSNASVYCVAFKQNML